MAKASIGIILNEFERNNDLLDQGVADLISIELSRREYPPHSITRPMIWYWRAGRYLPDVFMLEWLRDNAQDGRVVDLASRLLEAMKNGNG